MKFRTSVDKTKYLGRFEGKIKTIQRDKLVTQVGLTDEKKDQFS